MVPHSFEPPPSRKKKRRQSANSAFLNDLAENIAAGGLGPAARQLSSFESGTGFTLSGATIQGAFLDDTNFGNNRIEVLNKGSASQIGVIRVWLETRCSTTLLLVLDNGRGVPLAVLSGYIGHILVF